MSERVRARAWCFTVNNYSVDDEKDLQAKSLALQRTYFVCGRETGSNGTPHLQGYVEFKNQVSLSTLKKKLHANAHFEKRMGTSKQASDYCKKDGNFVEFGELSQQGARNDLVAICQSIVEKKRPLSEIAAEAPNHWVRYHKGFTNLASTIHHKPRTEMPKVFWIWGDSGSGKTRFAVGQHKDHYIKDLTQWWDGYDQNEAIIIDDFDIKEYKPGMKDLLRLLDRYQYQGQYKGGYVHINSPYIYVTAIEHIDQMFPIHNKEHAQIRRRLHCIMEMDKLECVKKEWPNGEPESEPEEEEDHEEIDLTQDSDDGSDMYRNTGATMEQLDDHKI